MDPRLESIRIPQATERTPRLRVRFLDSIASDVGVAKDEPGSSIQPARRGGSKRIERIGVATCRALDELSNDQRWSLRCPRGHRAAG